MSEFWVWLGVAYALMTLFVFAAMKVGGDSDE
jgi:hypothetical protein